MNKIMKKIMASALALTIVGGGLPALTSGTDIFESIVANADSNVKKIGVGVTLNFGETFDGTINDYGHACCAFDYINNPTTPNGQTFNADGFDSWTSLCTRYDNDRQMWLICDARPDAVGFVYGGLNPIAGRNFEEPTGIKVVSGNGKASDPFRFELVYEGEPKQLETDVAIGKKWYIGDEISTDAYFSTKIGLVNLTQYTYYLDSDSNSQTYNWLGTSSNKVIHLKNTTLSAGDFYVLNNGNAYLCFNDVSTGIFMESEDGFDRRFTKELGFEISVDNISNLNFTGSGTSSDPFVFTAGSMDGTAKNIIGIEIVSGSGTKADPFTLAPLYEKQPKLVSNTMTLGGSISLNFYFDLSEIPADKKADTYVEFEVNGKKQTANFDANKMNSKKTAYGFTCMLTSVSMADDVKATVHYFDENGDEKTFVTNSNGQAYLQKFDDSDGEKTYDLVKAVNDYGYYLQKYLCNAAATPWTYGVDHVSMDKCFTDTSAYENNRLTYLSELSAYAKQINKNADINKFNYSLSLEADTTLIVRVKPEASYTGSLDITVTDSDNNPVAFTTSKMADGRTQVNIPNISAHKLGDTYTVSVKTTNGTSTFKASALSYVYAGIKDFGSAEELNAMCSIYEYYKKTIAFRTK